MPEKKHRCKWRNDGEPFRHPIKNHPLRYLRWYQPQRCTECDCPRIKKGEVTAP